MTLALGDGVTSKPTRGSCLQHRSYSVGDVLYSKGGEAGVVAGGGRGRRSVGFSLDEEGACSEGVATLLPPLGGVEYENVELGQQQLQQQLEDEEEEEEQEEEEEEEEEEVCYARTEVESIHELPAITVTFDATMNRKVNPNTFKGHRARRASAPVVRLDS